jgi:hypothetical protein
MLINNSKPPKKGESWSIGDTKNVTFQGMAYDYYGLDKYLIFKYKEGPVEFLIITKDDFYSTKIECKSDDN